jgi:hypothetical protein
MGFVSQKHKVFKFSNLPFPQNPLENEDDLSYSS